LWIIALSAPGPRPASTPTPAIAAGERQSRPDQTRRRGLARRQRPGKGGRRSMRAWQSLVAGSEGQSAGRTSLSLGFNISKQVAGGWRVRRLQTGGQTILLYRVVSSQAVAADAASRGSDARELKTAPDSANLPGPLRVQSDPAPIPQSRRLSRTTTAAQLPHVHAPIDEGTRVRRGGRRSRRESNARCQAHQHGRLNLQQPASEHREVSIGLARLHPAPAPKPRSRRRGARPWRGWLLGVRGGRFRLTDGGSSL